MNENLLVEAINDLIRVTVAFNLEGSKSEAIRKLYMAGIKPARIASLLGTPLASATSIISKQRKSEQKGKK